MPRQIEENPGISRNAWFVQTPATYPYLPLFSLIGVVEKNISNKTIRRMYHFSNIICYE